MKFEKKYIVLLIGALLTGCSSQSYDYESQIKNDLNKITLEESTITDKKISDLYKNEKLSALITDGLKNNPSVNQKLLSLQISKLEENVVVANSLPNIDASFSGNKEKDSDKKFSSSLSVSWELDVWNKLSDATDVSIKTLEINEYEVESVKSLLAANIIRKWLDLNLYNSYIEVESLKLESMEQSKTLITQRYSNGIGQITDLDDINRTIYNTKSLIETYKSNRNQNGRELAVLIGDTEISAYQINEAEFLKIFPSIEFLGKQNLENRPDLKMAYKQLEIKDLSSKIAYKNMLPSLSLSAALSVTSDKPLESLLTSPLWSVLGQLTMPIFNNGSLKSKASIADLEIEQAYWNYKEVLLNAVKEVDEAVEMERTYTITEENTKKSLALLIKIKNLNEDKYKSGIINISELLISKRAVFEEIRILNDIIVNKMKNRVNLAIALGLSV